MRQDPVESVEAGRQILALMGDARLHRILEEAVEIELCHAGAAASDQPPGDLVKTAAVIEWFGVCLDQLVQQVRIGAAHRVVGPQMQQNDEHVGLAGQLGVDRDEAAAERLAVDVGLVAPRHRTGQETLVEPQRRPQPADAFRQRHAETARPLRRPTGKRRPRAGGCRQANEQATEPQPPHPTPAHCDRLFLATHRGDRSKRHPLE